MSRSKAFYSKLPDALLVLGMCLVPAIVFATIVGQVTTQGNPQVSPGQAASWDIASLLNNYLTDHNPEIPTDGLEMLACSAGPNAICQIYVPNGTPGGWEAPNPG